MYSMSLSKCWCCCRGEINLGNDLPEKITVTAAEIPLLAVCSTPHEYKTIPQEQPPRETEYAPPTTSKRSISKCYVQWPYGRLEKGTIVQPLQELAEVTGEWVEVTDQDGENHRIPKSFLTVIRDIKFEPWYFLNVKTRQDAERILLHAQAVDGLYFIRKCETDPDVPYVLSVKRALDAKAEDFIVDHIKIIEKDGAYGQQGEETFVTISAMVEHYQTQMILSRPCPKDLVINIAPEEIRTGELVGKGNFGQVFSATWNNKTVAVKYIDDAIEMQREIKQLGQFNHPQIVEMYGANISTKPNFMVMEYLCNGSLKTYVSTNKLETRENFKILEQVADGMRFLEKYQVIHRDLAARNILVGRNLTAKIADFGLSRSLSSDTDYYRAQGDLKLPILWLACESVTELIFTAKSDVWMFGILSMEVFHRGERPYKEFNIPTKDVVPEILRGRRMRRPEGMPQDYYMILTNCWDLDPKKRPSFADIHEHLMSRKQFEADD